MKNLSWLLLYDVQCLQNVGLNLSHPAPAPQVWIVLFPHIRAENLINKVAINLDGSKIDLVEKYEIGRGTIVSTIPDTLLDLQAAK